VEPDRLFECLPESLRPSSESPGNLSSGRNHHHEHQNGASETGGFKHLTLIPPRILPLLHDLAQQMVQAGNQQQLLRIYR
jgi:exocyst complex protein 7